MADNDTQRGGRRLIDAETAMRLLLGAVGAHKSGDPVEFDYLDDLFAAPEAVVDGTAETVLLSLFPYLWAAGWQPAELQRQGRLGCANAAGARLVQWAMATDHAGRRSATLHRRWVEQIESLELPRVDGRTGWVRRWVVAEQLDRARALEAIVDAVCNLRNLPSLDPILPPPGSGDQPPRTSCVTDRWGAVGAEGDPTLQRIRNLLAKAESTTFEAEAMAFTAKAQELMTRHAIDAALVHGVDRGDQPVAIRVPIDPPYVDPKSLLLQTVAEAGRCRTVFMPEVLLSTVVGYPSDIAAVELLFTSLLVQAQTAMTDAAKRARAGSRPRSQAFRSAFLAGYTARIGARLREINDAVYAEVEAERGPGFLPVLRDRSEAIDDFVTDRFGELASAPVRRQFDAAGWASGTVAADNARLSTGEFAAP